MHDDARLTGAECKAGWHLCLEYDLFLCKVGEMPGCDCASYTCANVHRPSRIKLKFIKLKSNSDAYLELPILGTIRPKTPEKIYENSTNKFHRSVAFRNPRTPGHAHAA
jgi:hypothetical protein